MATTPPPPYTAVIFTNKRTPADDAGYDAAAARMVQLAQTIDGFLAVDSVRNQDGTGITVSYWRDQDAIENWRTHPEHLDTQVKGRADWYEWYDLRIAEVTRASSFSKPS